MIYNIQNSYSITEDEINLLFQESFNIYDNINENSVIKNIIDQIVKIFLKFIDSIIEILMKAYRFIRSKGILLYDSILIKKYRKSYGIHESARIPRYKEYPVTIPYYYVIDDDDLERYIDHVKMEYNKFIFNDSVNETDEILKRSHFPKRVIRTLENQLNELEKIDNSYEAMLKNAPERIIKKRRDMERDLIKSINNNLENKKYLENYRNDESKANEYITFQYNYILDEFKNSTKLLSAARKAIINNLDNYNLDNVFDYYKNKSNNRRSL